ncbi:MAG: hypothetical protein PVI06_03100 [Desulfobacterales bacterium]|jgi:hypothetical protein
MSDPWENDLSCAEKCSNCDTQLSQRDQRILSVYTHEPICMNCKREEEKRPDYEDVSKGMIVQCIKETGKPYGDPGGYCFYHFCPYKC